ncbi:glycosyltransferase family 4 protein [Algibacter agarivorans]|uniref:Glycosyltransferase family 4 protein n=1 Tax=Algibacter agarivorans TaxID=1109741 RepID=A0ABP9GCN2_9FLAO
MKIAYIVDEISLSGGLEKMILVQADYFIKKFKYEIEIILLHEKSYASNPKYEVNQNIKLHYLDIISSGPKKYFHRVIGVNRKLKQINPDIVMVCSDEVFEMNLASLVKKRQPFIYQRHSAKKTNFVQRDGKKLNIIKYYLKKIILSRSGLGYDKVVLLTEEHKKDWPHLNKIEIINNPNALSTEGKRAKLENKVVIAVGRQDYVKGYDMLLKAWQKVIEKNPDWTLKFYGRVNKSLELAKTAENLGLINNVQFHEHTNDIISAYLDASILVCSSRTEGFSLVLVEAMSLGLPVVSFDCPYGPRAIITDSEDGILVEANNINQLSEALQSLMANIDLRKSMGKMAKKNVKKFTPDEIMKKWKILFEEVLVQ